MHVPPYHRRPGWQRFFVGVLFGALLAYWIVIFMYGTMYERLLAENSSIQKELHDAQLKIEALEKDKEDLNEKNKQSITVEEIDLEILNADDLKIDKLLQNQLEELIKEEIKEILGSNVDTIAENDVLLLSSIENKTFRVDDFTYSFEIKRLIISKTVKIVTEAKISD
ncbi:sporulation membrane protein YtrI [Ornithinibacillus contaminans]|uniref:sporulation membrane protein YtrI n=1 Tax=Ornithinibacillus contaminans TaxID=694055 RepID=UPI00064D8394|nr:sporulation membrane protein YtrI [Ornithinibacillus contaminans]